MLLLHPKIQKMGVASILTKAIVVVGKGHAVFWELQFALTPHSNNFSGLTGTACIRISRITTLFVYQLRLCLLEKHLLKLFPTVLSLIYTRDLFELFHLTGDILIDLWFG